MTDKKDKNPNVFEVMKLVMQYVALAGKIKGLNANNNEINDVQELMGLIFRLKDEAEEAHKHVEKCKGTLGEISTLVGDDLDEIKKMLGLETQGEKE